MPLLAEELPDLRGTTLIYIHDLGRGTRPVWHIVSRLGSVAVHKFCNRWTWHADHYELVLTDDPSDMPLCGTCVRLYRRWRDGEE